MAPKVFAFLLDLNVKSLSHFLPAKPWTLKSLQSGKRFTKEKPASKNSILQSLQLSPHLIFDEPMSYQPTLPCDVWTTVATLSTAETTEADVQSPVHIWPNTEEWNDYRPQDGNTQKNGKVGRQLAPFSFRPTAPIHFESPETSIKRPWNEPFARRCTEKGTCFDASFYI